MRDKQPEKYQFSEGWTNNSFPSGKEREKQASLNTGNYADGGNNKASISLAMQAHIIRESIRETKSSLKCLQFQVRQQLSKHLEHIISVVKNCPQKLRKLIKKLNIY